jgi:hypothetical protein
MKVLTNEKRGELRVVSIDYLQCKLQLGNVRQPTIKGYTLSPYPHSSLLQNDENSNPTLTFIRKGLKQLKNPSSGVPLHVNYIMCALNY